MSADGRRKNGPASEQPDDRALYEAKADPVTRYHMAGE